MDSMGEDRKNNEPAFEQWLDVALGEYGKVEPRAGLESRVLASLHVERGRIASQRRWWWALGTAAAAAAIVTALWIGQTGIGKSRAKTARPSTPTQLAEDGASRHPALPPQVPHKTREGAGHRLGARPIRDLAIVKPAKLEQFPSPAPLNEQEKMLARYVQEFPQRAALVARAQTLLRKQEEQERLFSNPRTSSPASSDQPE